MTLVVEGTRRPDRAISSLFVGGQEFYGIHRRTGEPAQFRLVELTNKRGGEAVLEEVGGGFEVTGSAEKLRRRGRVGRYSVTAVKAPVWVPVVAGEQHPTIEDQEGDGDRISIVSVGFDELSPDRRYILRFRGLSERTTFDTEAILSEKGQHSVEFNIDDMAMYTIQRAQVRRDPNNLGVTIYPQQVENPKALVFVQSDKLLSSLR